MIYTSGVAVLIPFDRVFQKEQMLVFSRDKKNLSLSKHRRINHGIYINGEDTFNFFSFPTKGLSLRDKPCQTFLVLVTLTTRNHLRKHENNQNQR